ncbi:MAG TPA: hypothetical protein VFV38_52665 [Ktedonobacteraceae bacterium]|nr:hypothetical protein [Ktedonobacteraceae bacterium]
MPIRRGSPEHFDRLRMQGGAESSRGEMLRMRAEPVLPVGLAWRRKRGEQAQDRKAAVYPDHCGHEHLLSGKSGWTIIQTTADPKRAIYLDSREQMA